MIEIQQTIIIIIRKYAWGWWPGVVDKRGEEG